MWKALKPYRKIIALIGLAELVVLFAFVAWLPDREAQQPVPVMVVEGPLPVAVYELDEPIVVNPAGAGAMRTLVVDLAFLLDSEETAKEIVQKRVRFHDALIGIFSHKYLYEFDSEEELAALKEQLKVAVNRVLHSGQVVEVCFKTLVMQ